MAARLCRSARLEAADRAAMIMYSPCQRMTFGGNWGEWTSEKQQDPMGLLAAFWGPVLISLLVCLRPSLMSPLLPLWFPPPLKNLSLSLCLSLQFAYRPNRSTDDAISQVLHSSLTHIDRKNGNYVRLLFIDYSSAFNTIVPTKLAVKLSDLGLNTSLCDWIQDFLTARPQVVKVGQFTSNSVSWAPCSTLSTHTTVCPLTAPLLSLNLLMILWSWASLTMKTRPHTCMRWRELHHGARTSVSLWTWAKPKSWSWTSGRDSSGPTLLLWSVGPLWRGWVASSTSV